MRYRKLSDLGDMTFGSGGINFHRDSPEGVAQAVWTRLRLWAGEWFLDIDEGMPYQDAVLGTGTRETIEPAMRQRILETQGVLSIEEFALSIDPENRVASIEAVINTEFGSTGLAEAI